MLGRTNTGGGGSGGLNFQVIGGTTAPSNPKENMIWVNTSTKITSYIFSATQPTGSAGMVWISTGTSSTIEFNALKKNGLQVYPIFAKQYVSGQWVDKTAKIYQNGEWASVATAPTNGLIAEYLFEAFSGNTIQDTSPNNYDLTSTNVTQGAGILGKSAYFSGDAIAVASVRVVPSGMSGFSGLTISFWIKTSVKPTSSSFILTQSTGYDGLTVSVNSSGYVYCTDGISSVATLNAHAVTDNYWHHVCLVYNYTTNKLQAWIDGVKSANSWSCQKFNDAKGYFTIGRSAVENGYYLTGSLDQLRLYNRALSDDEVKTLWNGGNGC